MYSYLSYPDKINVYNFGYLFQKLFRLFHHYRHTLQNTNHTLVYERETFKMYVLVIEQRLVLH